MLQVGYNDWDEAPSIVWLMMWWVISIDDGECLLDFLDGIYMIEPMFIDMSILSICVKPTSKWGLQKKKTDGQNTLN